MSTPESAGKELHVCAGLNACAGHGRSGTNDCAGTGDCATVSNPSCHGNNECRGQGGCGGGGSLGSMQTLPGANECRGKGSCYVGDPTAKKGEVKYGIAWDRTMIAAVESVAAGKKSAFAQEGGNSPQAITGIYEGRHVWQVARLLFEERMLRSGRTYTNYPGKKYLGGKPPAHQGAATETDYLYFGPPPPGYELGPGTPPGARPDRPLYAPAKKQAFANNSE